MIERSWDVDGLAGVAMVDGRAGVVNRAGEQLDVVELDTGGRERIELRTPNGAKVGTKQM